MAEQTEAMNRLTPAAIACLLLGLSACGTAAPQRAATAADVQISSKDLSVTLVRCSGSGDFNTFLAATKNGDTANYRNAEDTWADAKTDGAIAGQIATFSDSQVSCDLMNQPGGLSNSPGSPLIISTVLQFPDEAGAEHAYRSDSVMGVTASSLSGSGDEHVLQGVATGLGPNSITDSTAFLGLPFYVAIWQYRTFTLSVIAAELDAGVVKDVLAAQHARITRLNVASTRVAAAHPPLPDSATGSIGRPVALDIATITLQSVDLHSAASSAGLDLSPGERAVKVTFDVVFRKTGGGVKWKIRDSAGASYSSDTYDTSGMSVPPHRADDEHAVVWFAVPESATGLTLIVSVGPDSATIPLGG